MFTSVAKFYLNYLYFKHKASSLQLEVKNGGCVLLLNYLQASRLFIFLKLHPLRKSLQTP